MWSNIRSSITKLFDPTGTSPQQLLAVCGAAAMQQHAEATEEDALYSQHSNPNQVCCWTDGSAGWAQQCHPQAIWRTLWTFRKCCSALLRR